MTEVTAEQIRAWIAEARSLLPLFQDPIWTHTESMTDEGHVKDYASTLAKTRAHFHDLPEKTEIHAVMGEGNVVYAFTGNSPGAGDRAKAIVGFLNSMPDILIRLELAVEMSEQVTEIGARVSELIGHNNDQLMENRAQRETIRQQQAKIDWLLSQIPGVSA